VYAVTITKPGGPEVLRWTEVPDPAPGPGEVLVDVRASAVNRADILQRQGFYAPPPGASQFPGLECSGEIVALGDGVDNWRVGDSVCALLAGGGYAEKVTVPSGQLLPIPDGVDVVDAAALPEVACTVWSNVVELARLRAGETILIHGGGSGIGTFAIQLATALGAHPITTARRSKHDALKALGAERTVDYASEDFVAATREHSGGKGADVILDILGGTYLHRNVEALAFDGRLAIIGLQGGRSAELDLGMLLGKRGTITATTLRARPAEQKAAIVHNVREHVWPMLRRSIRPVIDRRIPMRDAATAHRVVEASEHLGKVLLVS
jgi:putative PIG3 family NAD(P)H quinone oxidoreductase